MNPRLKNSTKWTNFPQDYLDQIKEVFSQTFANQLYPKNSIESTTTQQQSKNLQKGEFRLEGRIYPNEILLRVGYAASGRLTQANFETSVDYDPNKQNAIEIIYKCVDAIAAMMLEYFEIQANPDAEMDFPLNWTPILFDGFEIFIQYSSINTKLEAEADRLLGLSDKKLIYDEENEFLSGETEDDNNLHEDVEFSDEPLESTINDGQSVDHEDFEMDKKKH